MIIDFDHGVYGIGVCILIELRLIKLVFRICKIDKSCIDEFLYLNVKNGIKLMHLRLYNLHNLQTVFPIFRTHERLKLFQGHNLSDCVGNDRDSLISRLGWSADQI